MSITISTPQQKALKKMLESVMKMKAITSVTNDLLRPIAKKMTKAKLPVGFKKQLPPNNDPLAWGEFSKLLFDFDSDSILWDWIFEHMWIELHNETVMDPIDLLALGSRLDEEVGTGFTECANAIVTGAEDGSIDKRKSLIMRLELVINNTK